MIGLAVVLGLIVAGFVALTALLVALADLSEREAREFTAVPGRRWMWVSGHFAAALVGVAVFWAMGRDPIWLLLVPGLWIVVEVGYLIFLRPRLERARPFGSRRLLGTAATYGALTGAATILMFPLYVTAVNSLLRSDQIAAKPPPLFPFSPQWNSYGVAWNDANMGEYLLNSLVQTTLIVVGQVVTAVLAGYAFARLRFPFRSTLFVVFLATLMIPFEVTLVTNLSTVQNAGLFNTYLGLALPFLATGFGAFLMRQAFRQVPGELSDAARLDGLGHLRFLRAVAMPIVRPTVAAVAVISFQTAWVQYLWPLLATKANGLQTVQIGVRLVAANNLNKFSVVYAALVIATIPLVFGLIIFQKQLIRGLTAGAVKG